MAVVILNDNFNGAIISMNVTAQNRIDNATVDATNATLPIRIWYPEDGSKIQVTVPMGQVVSQNFQGGNQLSRVMQNQTRPGDGATVSVWISPTWVALSP